MGTVKSRKTPQRDLIHKIISSSNGPVTVGEIHQLAKKQSKSIGIATIYRAINHFLDEGKITKKILPDGLIRYEIASKKKCFSHLLCRVCEKATCISNTIDKSFSQLNADFTVERFELTIHGVCELCKDK